jgi:hypothetical protein
VLAATRNHGSTSYGRRMSDPTPDQTFVRAVARQARLDLPEERVPALAEAAAPIHARLRSLSAVDLGETGPALSFDASWD